MAIKAQQKLLEKRHLKYVPVAVKIAPDLSEEELVQIADSPCVIKLTALSPLILRWIVRW